MFRSLILFFIFASTLYGQTMPDTTAFNLSAHNMRMIWNWRYQTGDHSDWASPDYDDSDWLSGDPNQYPEIDPGVHWLRAHVILQDSLREDDVIMLRFMAVPGGCTVYWDGLPVIENGKIGQSEAEEIPGHVTFLVRLPHRLTQAGHHTVAIKFSNFHKTMQFHQFSCTLAYSHHWQRERSETLYLDYLTIGIYLTAAFLSLALFLGGGRQRAFILFATYSFLVVLFLSIRPINEAFRFSVLANQFILTSRDIVAMSANICLYIFFLFNFDIPRKRIHLLIMVSVPILITVFGIQFLFGFEWRENLMTIYLAGLLVYAIKQRKPGSVLSLIGVLAFLLPSLYVNLGRVIDGLPPLYGRILVPMVIVFIFCILLSISRQNREQNRLFAEALIRSHRLETQLLKSQIQPHFISNTLHSIKSWFRDDVEKAERLIHTLSDEFRIINTISSKTVIPIDEEIRLCRYHLEIMGSRRDVKFELVTNDIPEDVVIPPLILHTLIENGLTHAYLPNENGRFALEYKKMGKETVFTLRNDGSQLDTFVQQRDSEIEEGLGMAYVKARLEESYPSRWKVTYQMNDGFWEVMIKFKD